MIAVRSRDRSIAEIKAHKVSGRLHARPQLEKIMNRTVIFKVFCGLDGEEAIHEERAKGDFKGK